MKPSVLGLKKSFGFGDRMGLATPGHIEAARKFDFAPIFAQQSIRELDRTQRSADEVMSAAICALEAENYDGIWGADADHLKTSADVKRMAEAGFTFFTIDPSAGVNNGADQMGESELGHEFEAQVEDGVWQGFMVNEYENQKFEVGGQTVEFQPDNIVRAVAKYGRAIGIAAEMAHSIERQMGDRPFEIEVSVDETDAPTSPLEHLFFALELKRRGVKNLVSLAPRFTGEMEKGIDYKGDLGVFEAQLKQHVDIARQVGPYKISVHSGSDKFSIYPIVGRVCGELLHVKTAGTSYLEALRTVLRSDEGLFREIAAFSHGRFDTDRASYHISTTSEEARALAQRQLTGTAMESAYLDEVIGRQVLHVTFGSVLTDPAFTERILGNLRDNAGLHREILSVHFEKHLRLLNVG